MVLYPYHLSLFSPRPNRHADILIPLPLSRFRFGKDEVLAIVANRLLISKFFLIKLRILIFEVDFFIHYPMKFGEKHLVGGAMQLMIFPSFDNHFKAKIHPFAMV